jgi:hypothetical protein
LLPVMNFAKGTTFHLRVEELIAIAYPRELQWLPIVLSFL